MINQDRIGNFKISSVLLKPVWMVTLNIVKFDGDYFCELFEMFRMCAMINVFEINLDTWWKVKLIKRNVNFINFQGY